MLPAIVPFGMNTSNPHEHAAWHQNLRKKAWRQRLGWRQRRMRRKTPTGPPLSKRRCPMRKRSRRSRRWRWGAEAAVLAVPYSPRWGRALEKIVTHGRLVGLRPLHLQVCYGVGLNKLRRVSVVNHTDPRAPCEKLEPRVVCVVSHERFCGGLPCVLIATVATLLRFQPFLP